MADDKVNVSETHDFRSLFFLSSSDRDFLFRNNGDQIKVESLKGKKLGLYFSASWCGPCQRFTPVLVKAYNELSSKGDFEIIFMSSDQDEESFNAYFSKMPWLAIPFSDKKAHDRVDELFQVRGIPHLVILGEDGKVLSDSGVEIIEEHGVLAYPFTPERFAELIELERAKEKAQTLESLLISDDLNFVIGKGGTEIPVSDLVGKNILLYFSAHWCPPSRAFLPKLIEAYHTIKAKDDAFEVILISSDMDQASFDDFFSGMPWLALPFGDSRKASLSRSFKLRGIPSLVAIGPSGQTVTKEAIDLVVRHGANAYPFTEERLNELQAEYKEMAKGWPEKLKSALHEEHELVLTTDRIYKCDGCNEPGDGWSFYCEECDFDLHAKCALEEDKEPKNDDKLEEDPKQEWVCDGEVCRKA